MAESCTVVEEGLCPACQDAFASAKELSLTFPVENTVSFPHKPVIAQGQSYNTWRPDLAKVGSTNRDGVDISDEPAVLDNKKSCSAYWGIKATSPSPVASFVDELAQLLTESNGADIKVKHLKTNIENVKREYRVFILRQSSEGIAQRTPTRETTFDIQSESKLFDRSNSLQRMASVELSTVKRFTPGLVNSSLGRNVKDCRAVAKLEPAFSTDFSIPRCPPPNEDLTMALSPHELTGG